MFSANIWAYLLGRYSAFQDSKYGILVGSNSYNSGLDINHN